MALDQGTIDAIKAAQADLAHASGLLAALVIAGQGEPPPDKPPDEPPPTEPPPATVTVGVWSSHDEVMALRTSGEAWNNLLTAAGKSWGTPKLSDLNNTHDVQTLAGALVAVRLNDAAMQTRVIEACKSAVGTEQGSRALEVSRNIACYVFAADLVGFRDPAWMSWLDALRRQTFDGRTIISTHEDRPNNWGTMAGAARAAIARYLGDQTDLDRASVVFHGYLGNRASYAGFAYGDLSWQADPAAPVGINPQGAVKSGHSIDGVLPDDQRRGGGFTWPPPKESYAWEGLQGVVVQAQVLARAGYDVWQWEARAIARSYAWLHDECHFPATGDDAGYPHIVNKVYGTTWPAATPAPMGKNCGWMDWTHGT